MIEGFHLLTAKGIEFTTEHFSGEADMQRFVGLGHHTFPQVFDTGELIGGFSDLEKHLS